jgi:iron complex outermembrane receptor protein
VQSSANETSEFFRNNTSGSLDQDEINVSAALSAQLQMNNSWFVSTGVGRAVRTPTILERYSDRFPSTRFQIAAEFLGTPEIEPESSLEFSLGTQIDYKGIRVALDTFYRQVDNYITIFPDPSLPKRLPLSPPTVFRYINGTKALYYGAEFQLTAPLGPSLDLRGSWSWLWAEDDLFNEPVVGTAPFHGNVGLRFYVYNRKYWIDFSAKAVDRQRRVARSRFERVTPGYAVFDFRSGLELPRDWLFKIGVENIGNRSYTNHLNTVNPFTQQRIPEIGRNFFVGLEWSF